MASFRAALNKYESNQFCLDDVPEQWVTNDYAEFNILIPHSLFKNGVYNKSSLETIPCFVEKDVEKLNQNEIIQLVRFGFCRIDCDNNIIYIHK